MADPESVAFCTASFKGDFEGVKALLAKNGELLNRLNDRKQTALYCAAMQGHKDIVEFLLKQKGINVNTRDNGSTPLHGKPPVHLCNHVA